MLSPLKFQDDKHLKQFHSVATEIEYPDVGRSNDELITATSPQTIANSTQKYRNLSLQETIQLALTNSDVLRDLGGTVVPTPNNAKTTLDPAIQETDPRNGAVAALSAFDADFVTRLFFEENDLTMNNKVFGDKGLITQDFGVWDSRITKPTATGGEFSIRQNVEYDLNNSELNKYENGSYTVNVDKEMRHPL